jgi:hypothetical protein
MANKESANIPFLSAICVNATRMGIHPAAPRAGEIILASNHQTNTNVCEIS